MAKKRCGSLYLPAFVMSAILMTGLMFVNGIVPFGSEKTILWIDANGQYISYFAYFKNILLGNESPLFTFAKIIGGDMVGLMAYYLLSPFNLVFLLFPTRLFPQAFAIVGVLKTGAAGLTAAIYFSKKDMDNTKVLLLSSAYGFMSYTVVNLPNIMWIDGVIILPLIALGIDRLFEGKSAILYFVTLLYGIFVNYYIGFMLCGASAIYFLYKLVKGEIKNIAYIIRYGISSICSGLLNMAMIIPALKSLEGSSKSSMNFMDNIGFTEYLSFEKLIKHILFPVTTVEKGTTIIPTIFVGFIITGLFILFFISKNVCLKNKLAAALISVIFGVSFCFATPYYIWHGFARPVWFEYRFAFIASFFMILIAAELLTKIALPRTITVFLIILNCLSIFWYGNLNYSRYEFATNSFTGFVEESLPIVDKIKEKEKDGFYRIEKDYHYSYNDAMTLGYNGLSHYSSGENLRTRKLLEETGYSFVEAYGYYGYGSSLANDSFMSIKYLLYKNTDRYGLKLKDKQGEVNIYENPYAFPLVIKADKNVVSMDVNKIFRTTVAAELLNLAWNDNMNFTSVAEDIEVTTENVNSYTNAQGEICYFPAVKGEKGYIYFSFEVSQKTNVYVLLIGDNHGKIDTISCGERTIYGYPSSYDRGIRYLNQTKANEKVTVTFEINGEINTGWLYFLWDDIDGLEEMEAKMPLNSYTETNFKEHSFSVSGTMDETGGLLMMIPYTDGWRIKVNEEKADYQPVLNNFVYVEVPEGQFDVDVYFVPIGFKTGVAISSAALLVTIIFLYTEKRRLK